MSLELRIARGVSSLWCTTTKQDQPKIERLLRERTWIDRDILSEDLFNPELGLRTHGDHLRMLELLGYQMELRPTAPLDAEIYELRFLHNRVPEDEPSIPGLSFVGTAIARSIEE